MSYYTHFFKASLNQKSTLLARYKYQITKQNQILNIIKKGLPKNLSTHTIACAISNNKLSLYTDSAAWASQLRFYHQAILQNLAKAKQVHIISLQIKVIPPALENKTKNKPKKNLPSVKNINDIFEVADAQPEGDLKNALLRLGKRFKQP